MPIPKEHIKQWLIDISEAEDHPAPHCDSYSLSYYDLTYMLHEVNLMQGAQYSIALLPQDQGGYLSLNNQPTNYTWTNAKECLDILLLLAAAKQPQ